MADILVVDDDQSIASAFERFLDHEGHTCTIVSNAEDAIRRVGEQDPDLVIMDLRMPGVDGLQALHELRTRYPGVHVVIMTAYGTSQTSIDAIRAGAFEYLTKPLDLDQLRDVIEHALTARRNRARGAAATDVGVQPRVALVGDSPVMQDVYKLIGRVAGVDVPALIVGERGTGKELVAATIHDNSARRDQTFATLDCGTMAETLLEQGVFGDGGGTVHLSAVHLLPRTLQGRLAQSLQEAPSRSGRLSLTSRVLASTDQDLPGLVESGAFSRPLYEMLSVIEVRLPPLRDRIEDVPVLVRHFIQRFDEALNRTVTGTDDRVLERLREHSWPGNVGELERVVKRACIVTRSEVLSPEDLGDSLSARMPGPHDVESALREAASVALRERLVAADTASASSVFHDIVAVVEATLVKEALAITKGNQVKASELLGVNRATLRKKAPAD